MVNCSILKNLELTGREMVRREVLSEKGRSVLRLEERKLLSLRREWNFLRSSPS